MGFTTFLHGRPPTHLRGFMWLAMSSTAIIQTPTMVSDGGGGGTMSWTNAGTTPCRIDPGGGSGGGTRAGRINEDSTHTISIPPGVNVNYRDRFVLAAGTFEILGQHIRTDAMTQRFEVIILD